MRSGNTDWTLAMSMWQQEVRVKVRGSLCVPDLVSDALVLSRHRLRRQRGGCGLERLAPGINTAFLTKKRVLFIFQHPFETGAVLFIYQLRKLTVRVFR